MQKAYFTGFCKFELEDTVQIIENEVNELYTIHDIFTIHSLKNKTTQFVIRIKDEEGFYKDVYEEDLILVNVTK